MILLLFFCSGATALIYEVIWSKYLSQMFGSTVQAQTVVLAVFMGGLALGNRIFGKRADLLSQPLAAYGYLEGAIGLYAFFFNGFYALADSVFVTAGSKIFEQSLLLLALKGVLSVGLLILPTVLMGGTLPLMAAWLQSAQNDAGRRSARFYSVNSLGAVAGSGLAGFLLIRELGMVSSLQITAFANVLIAIAAVAISRRNSWEMPAPAAAPAAKAEAVPAAQARSIRVACLMVALTGGVSMGLEVLASRTLSLIFGASLQAFAIVLMAFILGIGLGSAAVASPRARRWQHPRTPFYFMLGAAFFVGLFVLNIEMWTLLYGKARTGLAATEMGYVYHQFLVSVMSILVLGIPAALLGAVLPLWIRTLSESTSSLGNSVGQLLTWNTLGAVAGVLLTGFVLMPLLAVRGAFAALAGALGVVVMIGAWRMQARKLAVASGVFMAVFAAAFAMTGAGWENVLGSGIFRLRTTHVPWDIMEQRKKNVEILFYEDAPDASVSVEKSRQNTEHNEIVLRINGKPDASTYGDLSTQYLLGHLPMMARPASKEVFVLGFGSGITGGAVLGHPIDRLTIAENCAPILEASRFFEPANRGVLTNERVRIFREDARTVLKLDPQTYDIIISEPSNPWVAGIGSVFSKEFYDIAAARLNDGGIMAQWFHIYEMHDGIAMLVMRTFASVFPFVEIWDTLEGDIVLLGSKKAWKSSPEVYAEVFQREEPRRDLEKIGLKTPEGMLVRQIASQRTAFAIPGDGPIQQDGFPVLEYAAPKAFYIGASARNLFIFDERTWQSAFASREKQTLLASTPAAQLRETFGHYFTCNPDLGEYIRWRTGSSNSNEHGVYLEQPYLPIIFRPQDSYPRSVPPPRGTSPLAQRMMDAQSLIYSQPARWEEGAVLIETLLAENAAALAAPDSSREWLPAHFAALAARTRYANGDLPGAARTVELGLKISPEDLQLGYMKRLFEVYLTAAQGRQG